MYIYIDKNESQTDEDAHLVTIEQAAGGESVKTLGCY